MYITFSIIPFPECNGMISSNAKTQHSFIKLNSHRLPKNDYFEDCKSQACMVAQMTQQSILPETSFLSYFLYVYYVYYFLYYFIFLLNLNSLGITITIAIKLYQYSNSLCFRLPFSALSLSHLLQDGFQIHYLRQGSCRSHCIIVGSNDIVLYLLNNSAYQSYRYNICQSKKHLLNQHFSCSPYWLSLCHRRV